MRKSSGRCKHQLGLKITEHMPPHPGKTLLTQGGPIRHHGWGARKTAQIGHHNPKQNKTYQNQMHKVSAMQNIASRKPTGKVEAGKIQKGEE